MSELSTAGSGANNLPGTNGQPAPPEGPSGPAQDALLYSPQATRTLVIATAAGGFTLFWLVGGWLHIPRFRGVEASLLQQPAAGSVLSFVVAALLLVVCAVVGHFIAGRRWLYAGPFVAACGLAAWSWRGGPSRYVYFHAAAAGDGRTVFLVLALELVLLSLLMGAIWYFFAMRGRALSLKTGPEASSKPAEKPGELTLLRLQAIGAQVLMTALLVLCLTPVDAKKEVLASVFIASFIASSLTEYFFFKAELDAWFWAGPALTGIIGCLLNCVFNAAGAPDVTGHLTGVFGPLSRPLPLDYASAGMIGALLGFWTGGDHPEIAVGMLLFSPRMVMRGMHARARAR